jgi:hypothetical protein
MLLVPLLAGVVLILVVLAAHLLPSAQGFKSAAAHAQETARARTLAFASLAAALGAIGAYYSHKTFALNVEGHITDRFMRAVEQLSSDSREVRVGGIYALERVSRDSWEDHSAIVDVLAAFLREQSRRRSADDSKTESDEPDREQPEADVQAALTVLEMAHLAHVERPRWYRDLADAYSV